MIGFGLNKSGNGNATCTESQNHRMHTYGGTRRECLEQEVGGGKMFIFEAERDT